MIYNRNSVQVINRETAMMDAPQRALDINQIGKIK
jgi:hypothetical protein